MGLKDAVKKVKEKVQGMAERPYIGIDMAAGEDMTAYAGQQDAVSAASVILMAAGEDMDANEEEKDAQKPAEAFCEIAKAEMSNNERRRRGLPMVRRRANVRNTRNGRKRRHRRRK